jgi:hypothetical protein
MFQCGGLKNYKRMMESARMMKDTNRKEDILPRSTKEFFCAGLLSFHFQSKRSAVSLEV